MSSPSILMNSRTRFSVTPPSLFRSLFVHRRLIIELTKREVLGRYKGSIMGLTWSFFNPVFMLAIYTFVFSVVFKARWGIGGDESKAQFAIILFVGMLVHGIFSEVLGKAPGLIVSNANFVKKVVFPLEILPVVTMGAALFHGVVSLGVLLLATLIFNGQIPWTAVLIPIVVLPLILMTLGFAWGLASLGVYLRDVGQTITLLTTMTMFLSPVFYPITALPEAFRPWMLANPLTVAIEEARAVLIFGRMPDWSALGGFALAAFCVAWIGYAWFQKTRKGFADVI